MDPTAKDRMREAREKINMALETTNVTSAARYLDQAIGLLTDAQKLIVEDFLTQRK